MYFYCKQKTAYEMRISDWSSDVCSSDLRELIHRPFHTARKGRPRGENHQKSVSGLGIASLRCAFSKASTVRTTSQIARRTYPRRPISISVNMPQRSEEHTSELQSLMRISYAVFCLKKKRKKKTTKSSDYEQKKYNTSYPTK